MFNWSGSLSLQQGHSHSTRGLGCVGGAGHDPLDQIISGPNNIQQFQFQTSEILLYTGVQKLYGLYRKPDLNFFKLHNPIYFLILMLLSSLLFSISVIKKIIHLTNLSGENPNKLDFLTSYLMLCSSMVCNFCQICPQLQENFLCQVDICGQSFAYFCCLGFLNYFVLIHLY